MKTESNTIDHNELYKQFHIVANQIHESIEQAKVLFLNGLKAFFLDKGEQGKKMIEELEEKGLPKVACFGVGFDPYITDQFRQHMKVEIVSNGLLGEKQLIFMWNDPTDLTQWFPEEPNKRSN